MTEEEKRKRDRELAVAAETDRTLAVLRANEANAADGIEFGTEGTEAAGVTGRPPSLDEIIRFPGGGELSMRRVQPIATETPERQYGEPLDPLEGLSVQEPTNATSTADLARFDNAMRLDVAAPPSQTPVSVEEIDRLTRPDLTSGSAARQRIDDNYYAEIAREQEAKRIDEITFGTANLTERNRASRAGFDQGGGRPLRSSGDAPADIRAIAAQGGPRNEREANRVARWGGNLDAYIASQKPPSRQEVGRDMFVDEFDRLSRFPSDTTSLPEDWETSILRLERAGHQEQADRMRDLAPQPEIGFSTPEEARAALGGSPGQITQDSNGRWRAQMQVNQENEPASPQRIRIAEERKRLIDAKDWEGLALIMDPIEEATEEGLGPVVRRPPTAADAERIYGNSFSGPNQDSASAVVPSGGTVPEDSPYTAAQERGISVVMRDNNVSRQEAIDGLRRDGQL